MSDTGFLDPVSAFTVSGNAGGVRPWTPGLGAPGTLVSGVRLSDNVKVHASDVSSAAKPFVLISLFEVTAVESAQGMDVQGFTVRYERRINSGVTAAGVSENWLRLVSGKGSEAGGFGLHSGTTANANVSAPWTTTDTYITAGGSGSMLGMTTADASAGRFKQRRFAFAIQVAYAGGTVTSGALSIDHVQLQVHYHALTMDVQTAEWGHEVQSVGPIDSPVNAQSPEFGYEVFDSPVTGDSGWVKPRQYWTPANGGAKWNEPHQVTALDSAMASARSQNTVTAFAVHDFEFQDTGYVPYTLINAEFEAVYIHLMAQLVWGGAGPTLRGVIVAASAFPISGQNTVPASAMTSAQPPTFVTATATFLTAVGGGVTRLVTIQEALSSGFGVRYTGDSIGSSGSPPDKLWIDRVQAKLSFIGYTSAKAVSIEQGAGAASFEVFSGEWDYEAQSLAVTKNIVVESAEFDFEARSVAIEKSVQAQSSEYDWEARSAAIVIGLNVAGAEFDYELRSAEISPIVVPGSSEFDHEIQSASIQGAALTVVNFEWHYEAQSADFEPVIIAQSAEFDFEARSVALSNNVVVQSAEFDWEARSVELVSFFVNPGEWDWEARSAAIVIGLNVASAEFDHEIQSVSIATALIVVESEYDFEASSVFLSNQVAVQSAEFGHEVDSVQITSNLLVTNAEFGYEARSVSIERVLAAQSAEYDWEARSAATVIGLNVARAEFDHEIQSAFIERTIPVTNAEFGYEAGSPFIAQVMTVNEFERGWEAREVPLSLNLRVVGVEFEREFGSARIGKVIPVVGFEYGYEARSVPISPGAVPHAHEHDWEAESLDLNQFYDVSAGAIVSPEFDYEVGSVNLRQFRRPALTPIDRIKYARIGVID